MKNKLRLLAQIFNEIFDGDCRDCSTLFKV